MLTFLKLIKNPRTRLPNCAQVLAGPALQRPSRVLVAVLVMWHQQEPKHPYREWPALARLFGKAVSACAEKAHAKNAAGWFVIMSTYAIISASHGTCPQSPRQRQMPSVDMVSGSGRGASLGNPADGPAARRVSEA